ncbi:hypothetical protein IC757_02275 [Wenzhouxiangella sp. AB-CW3]|uniref:hypothetical protein n=1 Tax=Wenzhouxiangella sp. AB-CW3 TaxID=2771012 RepID=UPI00168A4B67|nr:hypothetical protein [Wenzhouxiangella sp. AB-CW3]QOC23011.1 hypothetical protein IC757_02275 [Wenzhouxiangella sp. AB-CW3]
MTVIRSTTCLSLFAALMFWGASAPVGASDGHHPASDGNPGATNTNVLEVITRHPPLADAEAHYEFVLSDTELPAGWTTINLRNQSSSTHFGLLLRMPEETSDVTAEEFIQNVYVPFQQEWDPYFVGEIDVEEFIANLMDALHGGDYASTHSSGPGMTAGGITSSTTVYLEPGTYFIECYILDDDGVFHTSHGMFKRFVVVDEESESSEPEADYQVSISSTDGLMLESENIQPGPATFKVTFEDNMLYGHNLGHDVHLIRLDGGTTVQEVNDWMDYLDVGEDGYYADRGAMVSASGQRGPQTFLGGTQSLFPHAETGQDFPLTAYFHADLTPGDYALVAEVPNPMQPDPENPDISMLVEFSVTPHAGLTGAWYDPATAGEGWNFVATPDGLFGYFYGYGNDGNPLWLMTEEVIADVSAGEPVTFNLLHGNGGDFSAPIIPDNLQHWGEVTFTFDDCDEATAEVSGEDGSTTHALERVAATAGLADCGL